MKKIHKIKHTIHRGKKEKKGKKTFKGINFNKTRKNKMHALFPIKPSFFEKKLCCSIRFYDNQDDIIKQFNKSKKYVETIKVSNNPNKDILNGNKNAGLYTSEILKTYPDNKFAQYLLNLNNKEFGTDVGFTQVEDINIRKWAADSSIKTKIAIFDWDGTISVIEGIILPPNKALTLEMFKKGITYKDVALYYAGTKDRFTMLQKMFEFLHEKNVKVYILTNNPVAAINWRKLNDSGIGDYTRQNFIKVVKQFIPQIKEQNVLCGYETDGFKPDTFSKDPYLNEVYSRMEHWHYNNSSATSI